MEGLLWYSFCVGKKLPAVTISIISSLQHLMVPLHSCFSREAGCNEFTATAPHEKSVKVLCRSMQCGQVGRGTDIENRKQRKINPFELIKPAQRETLIQSNCDQKHAREIKRTKLWNQKTKQNQTQRKKKRKKKQTKKQVRKSRKNLDLIPAIHVYNKLESKTFIQAGLVSGQ